MTVYTAAPAGGNWNSASTWVNNSGYPVAGDTVIIPATMIGTVTLNVTSACASIDMSLSGGTVAFNSVLAVTGGVSLGGTMTANSGGTLSLTDSQTLTSNGRTFPAKLAFNTTGKTYTLVGSWINTGLVTNYQISTVNRTTNETFTCNGGMNINQTMSGTCPFIWSGNGVTYTSIGYAINNPVIINCTSINIGSISAKDITYTAGVVNCGTGTLSLSTSPVNLNTNGMNWYNIATAAGIGTINLGSNLSCSATLTLGTMPIIFTGSYDLTVGTLTWSLNNTGTFTFPSGQTININTAMNCVVQPGYTPEIKASTPSSSFYLNYKGTAANQKVVNMKFTDVDASGSNQAILNHWGGTLTRCRGIYNVNNNNIGGLMVA